jgi:O-acetyl-ADP-ribose deacetylase (regulator of RNase III)
MSIIKADLLTVEADYIVHQTNCLCIKHHGIAASIFAKYPESDCYSSRTPIGTRNLATEETRDVPGTVKIVGRVINLFGQWSPGKVGAYNYPSYNPKETSGMRISWFTGGLYQIAKKIKTEATIAFPYQIGCGLAGGDWNTYYGMLVEFARRYPRFKVVICQLDS